MNLFTPLRMVNTTSRRQYQCELTPPFGVRTNKSSNRAFHILSVQKKIIRFVIQFLKLQFSIVAIAV